MKTSRGDKRLSDWFRQWRSPLRKFLAAKGAAPAADLDDIAQEVFLRLLRYERADLIAHPQAYLFRMATNVAAERALRVRHSYPHESQWLTGLRSDDRPEDNVARAAAQEQIERALNTLTPRQREVLKLQFSEGLVHAEIAARLGSTPRAIKRIVIKSYQKLRHELDQELLGVVIHGHE